VAGEARQFRVTTVIPHNRSLNNVVKVGNLTVNGVEPIDPLNTFNGTWPVTSVESKTALVFTLDKDPVLSPPYTFSGDMFIGEGHGALSADNGTAAVVEGNRVFHCITGGPWHDTGSTRDLIARKNYYHDIVGGPTQNMGSFLAFKACQLSANGLIATCDSSPLVHDLVVSQGVEVKDALVNGNTDNPFNGTFAVKSVAQESFTYEMTAVPAANATGSPQFRGAAQVSNLVIENNIIELALSRPGYWGQPTGILVLVATAQLLANLPYLFRQVVIRGNIIRQVADPPDLYHFGITVFSAEKLIVENNIIDVGAARPIQFNKCGLTQFFNNQTSAGKLIPGYNQVTQEALSRIEDMIDATLLLSV